MEVYVRRLTKKDIEKIIPMRVELQRYDHDGILEIDENILASKTRDFLNENLDKDVFMFGTFLGEELVSTCGLIIFKFFPEQEDLGCKVGYITSVFTKDEHREKGYQKKVFEKCLEFGKQMNIIRYKLSTKNPIAMKMYAEAGFVDDIDGKKMVIK